MVGIVPMAAAQTVTFTGTTQGCFSATFFAGCSNTFDGITFTGTSFSQVVPANGSTGFGNLGSFALGPSGISGTAGTSVSSPFTLFVTLTNPDINGQTPGNAHGPISGMLTGTAGFGGGVVFTPNSFTFGFTDPTTGRTGTGMFTFSTPTGIQPQTDATVTNRITGTLVTTSTVPEPSSMALLGTGLVGLVPMIRRRRR